MLFSEPKIPQSHPYRIAAHCFRVSVLFSEPKIPQSKWLAMALTEGIEFQCSSASRKFLNPACESWRRRRRSCFSALQRAENSSIGCVVAGVAEDQRHVSVLFSEPKIPQSALKQKTGFAALESFSALQRAENSSIPTLAPASIHISDRDDHASSFLSLPGASP